MESCATDPPNDSGPRRRGDGGKAGCADEAARLEAVRAHGADGLLDDPELRELADFAGEICDAPIAVVSLVEGESQRFLARRGVEATETSRSVSFCQYAMRSAGIYEVRDATKDPLFADNALVTGRPHIRFYAGAPLVSDDGFALGALCVIDTVPRPDGLTERQRRGLLVLSRAVMRRLSDRRSRISGEKFETALAESEAKFGAVVDSLPQLAWAATPDGQLDYFNARCISFIGSNVEELRGMNWVDFIHEDERSDAASEWREAVRSGQPVELEYRLRRHDGEYRWTIARAVPIRDDEGAITRWFGTNTDIHERREDRDRLALLSGELSHRIKNIFSLVSGLISFEARNQPELKTMTDAVRGRMAALGRAHDYVRPQGPTKSVSTLRGLLNDLFAPYEDEGGQRIKVRCDDIAMGESASTPLALVFHELATNAVKYGALSNEVGVVVLTVETVDDHLVMEWRECGGPTRSRSGKASFGTSLIDTSVGRQLRGTIERGWDDGFTATIRVPIANLA